MIAAALTYPQSNASAQQENTFKSSEFLMWERDSQEFYIDTTIGMANLIISQNDKAKGRCLYRWYVDDQNAAVEFILGKMREFSSYHPRGVIAAVIENKCGSMTFAN